VITKVQLFSVFKIYLITKAATFIAEIYH